MTLTPHNADVLRDLVILDANAVADLRTAVLEDQLAELRAELAQRRMLQEQAEQRAREARRHRRDAAALERALERSRGRSWWQRMVEVLVPSTPVDAGGARSGSAWSAVVDCVRWTIHLGHRG